MKRTHFVRTLVVGGMLLLDGGTATAQRPRPDFSGQWALANSRVELTIAQDASTLTVTGDVIGPLAYDLDGSESRNTTRTVTGEAWTHVSRAHWVTKALVVITTTTNQYGSWDWMATYLLDGNGNLNVTTIDATLTGAMSTSTRVYTRRR